MNQNPHLAYAKKKELILGFERVAVARLINQIDTLSIQDPTRVLAALTPDVVCKTRNKMEDDLSIVHPIVYMIVVNHAGTHFVKYKRGANGTEERLRDHSCGFGGHVDIIDFVHTPQGVLDPVATVMASAERELIEELNLTIPGGEENATLGKLTAAGLIYEPTDEVGNTHLAIVSVYHLAEGVEFASGEDDIEAPQWAAFNDPTVMQNKFENWSKITLDHADVILKLAGISGPAVSFEEMARDVQSYKAMQQETAAAV